MIGAGQWQQDCFSDNHHRARIRTEAGPDSGVAWHVRVPGLAHMLAKGLSGRHHRGYTDPRTANSGRVPERVERTTLLMVRAATWLFYSLAEYMMLWGLSYPICQTEEQ